MGLLNNRSEDLMKSFYVAVIFNMLLFSACSQKEEAVKLQAGTPAYELAKSLSEQVAFLDPEKNNVLVSTRQFDITVGEIFQTFQTNYGKRMDQLKTLGAARLEALVIKNAKELAEKKLLLNEAQKAKTSLSQAKIDSVLNVQYSHAGGEDNFLQMLNQNGVSIETVKSEMQKGLTIQTYLDEVLKSQTKVSEDELQQVYQEDKTASVRHILLMTQGKSDSAKQEIHKKMESILAEARAGADFAELAKKYTEDPGSKQNGGLYENFGRGRMVKPFEDAAFSVPVGEISDIVETQFGYHILKVVDRQKETRPFDEIREQLEKQLKQKKFNEAYQVHINALKEQAGFEAVESFN